MPLDIAGRINLQQLQNLRDGDYLYATSKGAGQIQTSAEPLKRHFLCIPYGTSKQHKHAFDQLKAQVRREYGVTLRADDPETGKITVGSVKRQIAAAQSRNVNKYHELLDKVRRRYADEYGDRFGAEQAHFTFTKIQDSYADGRKFGGAMRAQIDNQLQLREVAHKLEGMYGGGAGAAFLAGVADKLDAGEPLTPREEAQWLARFNAGKAVDGLRARIAAQLGEAAGQAAANALTVRIAALTIAGAEIPPELERHGQIPQGWADDAIDAALDEHLRDLDGDQNLSANQRRDARHLAQGRAQDLKSQQSRIGAIEQVIAGGVKDARLTAHPTDLFRPGAQPAGDVYQRCDDILGISRDGALVRLGRVRDSDAHVEDRLTEAQHIARLGETLRQNHVPPREAEYILHMEATLRARGAGDPNPASFSPAIANLTNARDLARLAISLEGNPASLDKQTIGQVMDLEIAERLAGRGADDFRTLSPRTSGLLQAGLASLRRHDVPLAIYGDYRERGARNAVEVVQCYKLGVVPEALHQNPTPTTRQALQRWTNAGFSEAEAHAYMLHFENPQDIAEFQGSLLKPDVIRAYRDYEVPFLDITKPIDLDDSRMIGDPDRLGNGAFNTVYLTRYRAPDAPNGYTERVFKEENPISWGRVGSEGKTTLRNCLASQLDQQLGFDVLAKTEVGIVNGQLGISMSRARGNEAYATGVGVHHREIVTPQSKYAALLRFRDRLDDPKLVQSLRKRYKLTDIRVDRHNNLVITPSVMAQRKDDPDLQRELTKLQLLDALLGNRDRHGNNYFVDFDPITKKVKVTGVDNDDAFNRKVTDPNKMGKYNTKVRLPPVVDRAMADAIRGIDETEYRQSISHLSDREADAAISRLRGVRQHLDALERDGRIIEDDDPDGWGSAGVTNLFEPWNSYVGRDCRVFGLVDGAYRTDKAME